MLRASFCSSQPHRTPSEGRATTGLSRTFGTPELRQLLSAFSYRLLVIAESKTAQFPEKIMLKGIPQAMENFLPVLHGNDMTAVFIGTAEFARCKRN